MQLMCLCGTVLSAAADMAAYSTQCCLLTAQLNSVIIHIQSTFDSIIWLNMNTLFGLLFGLNRIQ